MVKVLDFSRGARSLLVRILKELLKLEPNGQEALSWRQKILKTRDDIRQLEHLIPILLNWIEQVKVEIYEAQQREKDQIIQQAEEK